MTAVLLFHPGTAPFVQQVGRALYENGLLERFASTIIADENSKLQRGISKLAALAGWDFKRQIDRRRVTEFPSALCECQSCGEISRIIAARVLRSPRLTDYLWERSELAFSHWVAKTLLSNVQAVYGYEHASLEVFRAARDKKIRAIYDVPAPEHDFVQALLQREQVKHPDIVRPYDEYIKNYQQRRTQRRREEWAAADLIIANSEFTRSTYAAAGLDVSNVRVVPYGAPPPVVEAESQESRSSGPVIFLWAGTFSVRKGAHYLLQAWRQLKAGLKAELRIFGAMELPKRLLQDLPESVKFSETIPHTELSKEYLRADALVFPTLCDGFGMVATEAFAHGLPVITTPQVGAADFIRPEENGLLVPAGDAAALCVALEWCLTHTAELRKMRTAALETARSWQWNHYRAGLVGHVLELLK